MAARDGYRLDRQPQEHCRGDTAELHRIRWRATLERATCDRYTRKNIDEGEGLAVVSFPCFTGDHTRCLPFDCECGCHYHEEYDYHEDYYDEGYEL